MSPLTTGVARSVLVYNSQNIISNTDIPSSYISLLLHMDGANGSGIFIDSSQNALTVAPNGGTSITTSQSKFGGASAYFNNSWLSSSYNTALDLMGSDFTVEGWLYPTAVGSFGSRIASSGGGSVSFNGTNGIHWLFQLTASKALELQIYTSSGAAGFTSTLIVNLNAWNHITVCVKGSTAYIGLNGVVQSATLPATPLRPTSNPTLAISGILGEGASYPLYGYMDEFRILKGLALYTSNYTVPTAAFSNPYVPQTYNPITALNPIIWYDFDDPSTVTLSSSTITQIADKGSRGWTLTKSSTGPTQSTWTNNSRKCCDWGSSSHSNYLRNTSSTSTNIAEVYIVLDAAFGSTFPSYNGLITGTSFSGWYITGNQSTTGFYVGGSAFDSVYVNNSASNSLSSGILPAANSPSLLRLKNASDTATTITDGFQLAQDRTNLPRGWYGLIAEVVVFSSVLSSTDRTNVQNYLATKWGLTLS